MNQQNQNIPNFMKIQIFFIFCCLIPQSIQQPPPPPIPNEHLTSPASVQRPFSEQHQQQEEIIMAIVVEARSVECLYQTVSSPKHHAFEIDYQVIEGGDNDITFSIKSPNGVMIVIEQRKTDGSHKITLDDAQNGRGDYAICFDNTHSYSSRKRVFFEIFLMDKEGKYLSDYDLKMVKQGYGLLAEQLETFNRVTNKVKNNLNEVERIMSQFRAVEARDRSSIETAFERINFWSVVNLLCLLFAGGVQVYMVRSLFMEDSRVGKFVRHGKFN